MQSTLDFSYGKTSLEFLPPPITPLAVSSAHWWDQVPLSFRQEGSDGPTRVWLMDQNEPQRGPFAMLNTTEFPSDGGVSSSLADVLETSVLPKYYLSAKACAGILRRAEKRGRELPPSLQTALEHVALTITKPKADT